MHSARHRLEAAERHALAPFAVRSSANRGRRVEEPSHPVRPAFQRDRDRILHSRCFRRLEYKTQVFINGTADHYRTRLTHTMEMAAVGRTLARLFRVNEDLTESICLAHDVGHSPFGHRGEAVLNELMSTHGGFDHNLQSLRAVDLLEVQYPGFRGLNLTWDVRAGLLKHQAGDPEARLDGHPLGPHQSIEAQIADLADDMTYHAHDTDDGLDAGLITPAQLDDLAFWRLAAEQTRAQYTALDEEPFLRITIRNLLDLQARDVQREGERWLGTFDPRSPGDVMNAPGRIIRFSPEMTELLDDFAAFLYRQLYDHPAVLEANEEAVALMRGLFMHYAQHPETMGRKARARLGEEGLIRTVCDYVAGCTDRYAIEECHRFGITPDNASSL